MKSLPLLSVMTAYAVCISLALAFAAGCAPTLPVEHRPIDAKKLADHLEKTRERIRQDQAKPEIPVVVVQPVPYIGAEDEKPKKPTLVVPENVGDYAIVQVSGILESQTYPDSTVFRLKAKLKKGEKTFTIAIPGELLVPAVAMLGKSVTVEGTYDPTSSLKVEFIMENITTPPQKKTVRQTRSYHRRLSRRPRNPGMPRHRQRHPLAKCSRRRRALLVAGG